MSHNIRKDNVFVTRDPAWHKIGTVFANHPSVEEALEKMGGQYQVVKVPCVYKDQVVPEHFFTVRNDTDEVLGVVGTKYHVIQTLDGFKILDDIGGDVIIHTGGVLGKGEKIFIGCKLPSTTKIAGDLIEHYFVLVNSHDGSGACQLVITPTRVVCQNTVNMALQDAVRKTGIRHTVNYERRLQEAARILGITKNYYTKFEELSKLLLKKKFSEKQFFTMVDDQLNPAPADDESQRAKTLHERTRSRIIDCYNAADLDNIRETGWGALNAIADYSDHARSTRGKDEARKAANEFIRTFEHTDIKDRALELILATR